MLKQLGEQDAGFLYLETSETPQHVGGVSLVELPPGYTGDFFQDYKQHIASRVHLIPMLHMKLVPLPFDIDHPFWTDDPEMDIDYHIRRLTLPRPGRISQLEQLVGRLHSNFLDRSRPLWEFYVIDGLESGQVALYTKIHHAAMDGGSSAVLISTMYDLSPVPRQLPAPPPKDKNAKTKVDINEVLQGVAAHFLRQEIRLIQFIPDLLKTWANLTLPDIQTLKYDKGLHLPRRTPKTLFNVGITSQRAYAMRSIPLGSVKKLASQAGVKLNDVILAICSGALRRYLLDRDGLPKDPMTAMVPISLHKPGDTEMANQNAMFICNLATDIDDPYDRLMAIRESSTEEKKLLSNVRNALMPDLSVIGAGALTRGMAELYSRAKIADRLPPLTNLTISNVAGPPVPMYIAGAKLLSMHPCSIPFHGSAVNITVESYAGALDFGLIACRRTVPDVTEIADHLVDALSELQEAVNRHAAGIPFERPALGENNEKAAVGAANATKQVLPGLAKPVAKASSKVASKAKAPVQLAAKVAAKDKPPVKAAAKTAATAKRVAKAKATTASPSKNVGKPTAR